MTAENAVQEVTARLERALATSPIIAILRGLRGEEAIDVVETLYAAGIRVTEVPLNSPDPFETIRMLVAHFGDRMLLGAGTVTAPEQVAQLADTGAALCVAPNTDARVIQAALEAGLLPLPGFQTPSEAFAAHAAGARWLKFFNAAGHAADLAALRVVLPRDARVVAVGGVEPSGAAALYAAGACAFGIGSDLYRPGMPLTEIGARAIQAVATLTPTRLTPAASLLCNPGATLGTAPLWRASSQRVAWVDPLAPRLLLASPQDGEVAEHLLREPVWSLATLPCGAIAATCDHGYARLDEETGEIHMGPTVGLRAGHRFNVMAADAHGGLWAGVMHRGQLAGAGALYYAASVTATPREVASGLGVPNGMAFSADQRTLYVIDTVARTLLAYQADVARGALGEPVMLTDFLGVKGQPGGMAIARDGTLWVAMAGGDCVVHIGADGALLRQVPVPAPHVSGVCFCPDGTLFVTSSRMHLSPSQLAASPGSGGLFAVTPADEL
jgi:Entner-Doudoroff aldolase